MKRTLYTIIICMLCCLSGCEENSYGSFSETQVQLKESDVTFTAAGGTGRIVVAETEGAVLAVSNESWCTASVSGSIVSVTVTPNMNIFGRTALITLTSQGKVNYVPVSQMPVYFTLESYGTLSFLGTGGVLSVPYSCSAALPIQIVTDSDWLTATVGDKEISFTASVNPDFLNARSTAIKIIVGDNMLTYSLQATQGKLIESYEPDPTLEVIEDFLGLMNQGTSSRYKVVYFSERLAQLYSNLQALYPEFKEVRIQAPRSTYKLSIVLYNQGDAAYYYYWNATNGLVPIGNSKFVGWFDVSGNTYSGSTPTYLSDTNYTQLRAFFVSAAGFMIFPESEGSSTYWFRSVANPEDYFKVEPF